MKLSINLELHSLDQLRAIESAVDLLVDMESEREKDGAKADFGPREKIQLTALRQVQNLLAGKIAR